MAVVNTTRYTVVADRPVYRRPDWAGRDSALSTSAAPFSNTWGSGAVHTPTVADRERRRRIAAGVERPFDVASRWARIRRRMNLVAESPGVCLLALVTFAALLGAGPVIIAGSEPEPAVDHHPAAVAGIDAGSSDRATHGGQAVDVAPVSTDTSAR